MQMGWFSPLVILHAIFEFCATEPDDCIDRKMFTKVHSAVMNTTDLISQIRYEAPSFDAAINAIHREEAGYSDFTVETKLNDFVIYRSEDYVPLFVAKLDERTGVRYLYKVNEEHPLFSREYLYPCENENSLDKSTYGVICNIARNFRKAPKPADDAVVLETGGDAVNSPSHYTSGGIECIDAIKASMTTESFRGFNKGNVMKYLWRQGEKEIADEVEDANKALWYLMELLSTYDGGMERIEKTFRSHVARHADK